MTAVADCSLSPGDLAQICAAMGPVIKQAIDEEISARRAKARKAKEMIAPPKMKTAPIPQTDDKPAQYAKAPDYSGLNSAYYKPRQSAQPTREVVEVAGAMAEAEVYRLRREGKDGNMAELQRRYQKELTHSPSKLAAERHRYSKALQHDIDKIEHSTPAQTLGFQSPIEIISRLARKRVAEKQARGERANFEQERLAVHREMFERIKRKTEGASGSGSTGIPNWQTLPEYADDLNDCFHSIMDRASKLAADRVYKGRARGQNLSFSSELRDAIAELEKERDENSWKFVS